MNQNSNLENVYYVVNIIFPIVSTLFLFLGLKAFKDRKGVNVTLRRLKEEIKEMKEDLIFEKNIYQFKTIRTDYFNSKKDFLFEYFSPNQIGFIENCYKWINEYNSHLLDNNIQTEIKKLKKLRVIRFGGQQIEGYEIPINHFKNIDIEYAFFMNFIGGIDNFFWVHSYNAMSQIDYYLLYPWQKPYFSLKNKILYKLHKGKNKRQRSF